MNSPIQAKCKHGNPSATCDWCNPAASTYTTLSGLTVYKGQTQEQAQKEADERRLWIGIYGSPEYGGWATDPSDGRRKPVPEIVERAIAERE